MEQKLNSNIFLLDMLTKMFYSNIIILALMLKLNSINMRRVSHRIALVQARQTTYCWNIPKSIILYINIVTISFRRTLLYNKI